MPTKAISTLTNAANNSSEQHSAAPTHGSCERLDLNPQTPWWGEHRCRYRYAQPHVRDAKVLDIACGTGFGAVMLAEAGAAAVTGVDIDYETVVDAQRQHGDHKRAFLKADGTRLPFDDAAFDVITSFETLEHIPAAAAFLDELRRVLKPQGTLILSTPNRDYTELNGQKCENPFHVREYTRFELKELLSKRFAAVELVGQRIAPEYYLSPFVADHNRQPMDALKRTRLLAWKVQQKLPFGVRDNLSRLFSGHPFYPSEEHYLFTWEQMETAPTLVALCHP